LCFICQTAEHVGRDCPEWLKPLDVVQYLGSAAQGLDFFHVDVRKESNRSGYMKFLDNCAIFTVEEGLIDEPEIVESLRKLFDQNWHWQLKEIEEFKYLVRFPPHKQISTTLISDVTYFKMKKEGVLVSLKAWTCDIDPYDTLEEVWVQISGVPPKWSSWRTFRHITSSLDKMVGIDWNSLFTSFFRMVRVKLECKDVSKIPRKMLFELKKNLYLIQFKVEGKSDGKGDQGDDGGDSGDQGNEDDQGMEELDQNMDHEVEKAIEKKIRGRELLRNQVVSSLV
jgi:hypothetical protein